MNKIYCSPVRAGKILAYTRQELLKDMSLFSSYTKLPFSLIKTLRWEDIGIDAEGRKTAYTRLGATVLHPLAINILEKYEPPFEPDHSSYLFPLHR